MAGIETLRRLRAKTEDFELPTGDKIKLKGLTLTELSDLAIEIDTMKQKKANFSNKDQQNEFLLKVFRNSFPDVEEKELREEIDNIGGEVAMKIILRVRELSGLKSSDTPLLQK